MQLVELLAEVGAWGVNLHDNDLVPIDASAHEREQIVSDFRKALDATGLVVPMATTNLFRDPVFRDGAFTANDPRVRALALRKTMRAIDLGVELGATTYVFWGGREGVETDSSKDPLRALGWYADALNFLCGYVKDQGYDLRFALESKPNEPRGDIYLATTGAMLAFISTLDHPEMVGVNPEVAHEHMAGLNSTHHVAQAWSMGKLFHIDLNDQITGSVRPGPAVRLGEPEGRVLPREVPRGCRVRGQPPLRRPRVPDLGLRGREGVRARMHAHLPDLEGEGRTLERRPRDPGARGPDRRGRRDDGAVPRSRTRRNEPTRSAASSSTGGRSPHADSRTSGSISSRSTCCSGLGDARGIHGSSAGGSPTVSVVLGLDVSTTATKAVILDETGAVRASAAVEYPFETPHPRWSEQDPNVWWDAAVGAIRTALGDLGGDEVEAVGLTGQMHGLVALDARGPGPASRDPVERSTDRGRMRRDPRRDRSRPADPGHGQRRAARVHRAEAPVGPATRARRLVPDRPRPAAEGPRSAPADRRSRRGPGRRRRDAPVRPREARLVEPRSSPRSGSTRRGCRRRTRARR